MHRRRLLNLEGKRRGGGTFGWQPFKRFRPIITLLDTYSGSDVFVIAGGLI